MSKRKLPPGQWLILDHLAKPDARIVFRRTWTRIPDGFNRVSLDALERRGFVACDEYAHLGEPNVHTYTLTSEGRAEHARLEKENAG